jgi:hypothetical protein
VSAASFLVIRQLGQEQERRRKKLPQKRRCWMTTVFKSREIYSGSDLLEDLGVENLHFKAFCHMSPSSRVPHECRKSTDQGSSPHDWAACREPL